MGRLMLRRDLSLHDRIEKHGAAHIGGALGLAVELLQRCGDIHFHLEDPAEHPIDTAPVLPRGRQGFELDGLAAGDQVVGEQAGVMQFVARLLLQVVGKTPQLPFGKPQRQGPVRSARLTLHGEVLLQARQQLAIHGLGHGAPCGAGADRLAHAALGRCDVRHGWAFSAFSS